VNFKQWYLNEVGTGTNCVAVFARPIFGELIKRTWPPFFGGSEEEGEFCRLQGKPGGVTALGYGCGDGSRKK
jgi:hypothetical protein